MSTADTTENVPALPEIKTPDTVLKETGDALMGATVLFFDQAEKHVVTIEEKYRDVVWTGLDATKSMQDAVKARAEARDFRTKVIDRGHKAIKAPMLDAMDGEFMPMPDDAPNQAQDSASPFTADQVRADLEAAKTLDELDAAGALIAELPDQDHRDALSTLYDARRGELQ